MLSRNNLKVYLEGICDVCFMRLLYWSIESLELLNKRMPEYGLKNIDADRVRAHFMSYAVVERHSALRNEAIDFFLSIKELFHNEQAYAIDGWLEQQIVNTKDYCLSGNGHNKVTAIAINLRSGRKRIVTEN